eukprot:TRINITY_DN5857_c0_g1_i1.p1 TRINITY_DN5857_c0_g1~~TRINITY_DN5857_c0_g1_i1.p1  ORF type:complete len:496 (-),score=150.45 TRINITY_DN5857_c0_g1_i1:574-2061(-)
MQPVVVQQVDREFGHSCCHSSQPDYEYNSCCSLCRYCDLNDCCRCCPIGKYNHCVRFLLTLLCLSWFVIFILVLCVPAMGVFSYYDEMPLRSYDTVLLDPRDVKSYGSISVGQVGVPLVVRTFRPRPVLNSAPVSSQLNVTLAMTAQDAFCYVSFHVTPGSSLRMTLPSPHFSVEVYESSPSVSFANPVFVQSCSSSPLSHTYQASADTYAHFAFLCCGFCETSINATFNVQMYQYNVSNALATYTAEGAAEAAKMYGYTAVHVPLAFDETGTVAIVTAPTALELPPVIYYPESNRGRLRIVGAPNAFIWRMNVRDELWWPLVVFFATAATVGMVVGCMLMRKRCKRKVPFGRRDGHWNNAVVPFDNSVSQYGAPPAYEMREWPVVPLPPRVYPVPVPPEQVNDSSPAMDKSSAWPPKVVDDHDSGTLAEPSLDSSGSLPDTDQSVLCVVCLERRRELLLLPCHHICLCSGCAGRCRTCPICRSPIQRFEHVFLA